MHIRRTKKGEKKKKKEEEEEEGKEGNKEKETHMPNEAQLMVVIGTGENGAARDHFVENAAYPPIRKEEHQSNHKM